MTQIDYNSPSSLKAYLEEQGMAMQKKFGQNFMVSKDARKKIVDAMTITPQMNVWEIGPGLGCMTEEMLERGANVTVFEIDRGFISSLHTFFDSYEKDGKMKIIEGDVLKQWKKECTASKENNNGVFPVQRLTGNLPYNIAATFIADTITANVIFDSCIFTVQKEVADRMIALPGTENYSSFSVLCQWAYSVKSFLTLAPGNFWPKPNVSSAAVIFEKRKDPLPCTNPSFFVTVVHTLFSSRRKTINNNIKMILPSGINAEELFSKVSISPSARAEELSVEQLLLLSETLSSAILQQKQ